MSNSYKNKVIQFWEAFEEEEGTIREMINNQVDGDILTSFTDSILKIVFKEIHFQIGINHDNKYELILSPQGDRVRLIQYHYWLQYAPIGLFDKWVFYASKPALTEVQYKVDMFGVTLEDKDITLYPAVNHAASKVELKVYCPKLNSLPESQRYSIFFIFLDQYISELYTIEHISNIQFVYTTFDEDSVNIHRLKRYIDKTISKHGWINPSNPLHGYLGYTVKKTVKEEWVLREDVSAGYSSCTAPISAYHFKDEAFFNKYKDEGIIFGFLFYENIDIIDENIVSFRAAIEDRMIQEISSSGIANCLGGATGFHFSYIDFIIYDQEAFLKIAKQIMSEYTFEESGFSYFLQGAKPILFL